MHHPFLRHLHRMSILPQAVVDRLDPEAIDAALSEGRLPEVPPGTLRAVVDSWTDYATIAAISESWCGVARLPACLEALTTSSRPSATCDDLARLEAATLHAIDGGTVRGRASRPDHPGLQTYSAHLDHVEALADVSPHRWLALERAQLDGVLFREYRWPDDLDGPEWLLSLVPSAVEGTLHRRSRSAATWAGADVLIDLLTSPARREPVAAVARLGASMALVVRTPDGDLPRRWHGPRQKIGRELTRLANERSVSLLVAPAGGVDLASIDLPRGLQTLLVRNVALHRAAKGFSGPRVEALAVAVADRAQDPRAAWGRLDPATLGLVEYQNNLDPAYVGLVLSLAARQADEKQTRVEAPATGPSLSIVNRIEDLRPGMIASGTVTQIAPFGAFVDIGVGREGLIHISELADERVDRPTDVVHVGQRVTPRVLEVDRQRNRISLSLRSEKRRRPPRSDSGRKKAIDALEKLFK